MSNRSGLKAAIAGSALLASLVALVPEPAASADKVSMNSKDLCASLIRRIEGRRGIPARLLGAISIAESGRFDAGSRAIIAWPWTVNAGGDARYYASKAQAVAGVRRLKARGVRNIDVGCMQVNLMHHPKAFGDLEAAFNPATNVAYAAGYLKKLHGQTGSWVGAVASYHSSDVRRGHPYLMRVLNIWMGRKGGPGPTRLAGRGGISRAGSLAIGKPARPTSRSPRGIRRSASLVRRAAALRTVKTRRKWAEVMARRKRFAELLGRRQAARRAKRDPS